MSTKSTGLSPPGPHLLLTHDISHFYKSHSNLHRMIRGNTALRSGTSRQDPPTCSHDYYTVRFRNVNGTTVCSFAPLTGLDGFIGPQLYQYVDLNLLLSLPTIPERISPNEKYLKTRIAFLREESQHALPGLGYEEFPNTNVLKLTNSALRVWVNNGELVHLRAPIALLHQDYRRDMELCNPPISAARYEFCWEIESFTQNHGVVRGRVHAPPGSSVRIGNLILDALWSTKFKWYYGSMKRQMSKREEKGDCVLGDVLALMEKALEKRVVLVSGGVKNSRIVLEGVGVVAGAEKRDWRDGRGRGFSGLGTLGDRCGARKSRSRGFDVRC